MTTLLYTITLLSALLPLFLASEVGGQQKGDLGPKHKHKDKNWNDDWGYGPGVDFNFNYDGDLWPSWPGLYGYGYPIGGWPWGIWFAKSADNSDVARRAIITLEGDDLHRRGQEQGVSCLNEKGQADHVFLTSDCVKAADKMAEKKLSTSSCGTCKLKLANPKGDITPTAAVTAKDLEKVARGILNSCTKSTNEKKKNKRAGKGADSHDKVAMVLMKGDNNAC